MQNAKNIFFVAFAQQKSSPNGGLFSFCLVRGAVCMRQVPAQMLLCAHGIATLLLRSRNGFALRFARLLRCTSQTSTALRMTRTEKHRGLRANTVRPYGFVRILAKQCGYVGLPQGGEVALASRARRHNARRWSRGTATAVDEDVGTHIVGKHLAVRLFVGVRHPLCIADCGSFGSRSEVENGPRSRLPYSLAVVMSPSSVSAGVCTSPPGRFASGLLNTPKLHA